MKTFCLVFSAILLISCKKEVPPTCEDGIINQEEAYTDCGGPCAPCEVTYPANGPIGQNLLAGDEDTLYILASTYSFKAEIAPGSSLQITSNNLSGDPFQYGFNNGWTISNASNGLHFFVSNPGSPELTISLINTAGTAQLDYKENGDDITKQKIVVWG